MTKVLIPLAEGCEELEAVTLIDLLRRAGITVVTASLTDQHQLTASRGVGLVADATLDDVIINDFDMLVLPGGQPGTDNLNADPRIHAIAKRLYLAGKPIAAICAAPLVFVSSGLLEGKKVACYPGSLTTEKQFDIDICDDAIVVDNNIFTSRGPGTAMDFALTLIEHLANKQTRDEVEAGLVR